MAQDEQAHWQLVVDCLARMGVGPAAAGHDLLPGGISGSHAYRVRLGTEAAVLKVTLAGSEPYIWQRAQREYQFYHTLAGQVPLRVPRMLASDADDTFGICILLAAYRPADPPQAWQEGDFMQVAGELAGLHAAFWGRAGDLAAYPWLREPERETQASLIRGARDAWRELLSQERFRACRRNAFRKRSRRGVLAGGTLQALYDHLERVPEIDASLRTFPLTLCHGDCHIGNLLRDVEGHLVWADWQEVGIGRGPEDLSFLLQRAFPAGEAPVAGRTVAAYQAHLEARTGERIPLAAVQRVMDGSELRMRLLHWPFYLQQAPAEWVTGMVERITLLAERVLG